MKTMKKLGSFLLAFCMCMSLCVTAFADEANSYTITIDPAYSGETYTAYKVFDATYTVNGDMTHVAYTIDFDSPWFDQVAAATDVFKLTQISGSNIYTVERAKDIEHESEILKVLSGVPDSAVAAATATPEFEENEDGSSGSGSVILDVTESGAGYYFVTTSLGSVVSINTAAPDVTIEDKNSVPTLTKELENVTHNGELEDNEDVTEGTRDTAKVGDIIEFEIKISHAANKSALCLHDYTQEGLTYYGSDHINVYLNSVSASNKVSGDWYTIRDSDCEDGCDFEIVFNAVWLDDLSDDDVIIITYEAVVNESAVQVNLNDAFLTYGVGGYSVVVETETDVYGLRLKKIDGEDGSELEGATFTLAYSGGTLVEFYFDEGSNTYIVHDAIDEEYADEKTTTNILVGSAAIFGLDAGTYTLTETVAPNGYNQLTEVVPIVISDDGSIIIVDFDSGVVYETDGEITVVNNAGAILPSTGGIGTTIFYVIGVVLVCGAAVLLITRRRMSREA